MARFTEPQMRPPQEAHSLLVRATQGCTYNKCSFCYVSRGYPFMAVTDEELALEAEKARFFFPSDKPIYRLARERGNSDLLVQAFVQGARETGHTVDVFVCGQKPMVSCMHCGGLEYRCTLCAGG